MTISVANNRITSKNITGISYTHPICPSPSINPILSHLRLEGKIILVTGGTGSFGQKFTEVILKEHEPKEVRIYSRSEFLQWEMSSRFSDKRLRFFIGDVRDRDRISQVMAGVNIVIHAAALKHVPIAESNPTEAINTNINGTINVVGGALSNNVEKVMLISSDKAVEPLNLYGCSKRIAEKLFIQANEDTRNRGIRFSCVRYGNVAFSRGSIIPLWLEQKKSGKITITDGRMTRFWITLEQGVKFVMDCIGRMQGGEIFIPLIPSVRIMDLADAIAPDATKIFTGIRPGEKLHEVLIAEEEARDTVKWDFGYVIKPGSQETNLPDGLAYSSIGNNWWLTKGELKEELKGVANEP